MVVANIIGFAIATVEPVYEALPGAFALVEYVTLAFFTAEYAVRLWVCVGDRRFGGDAPTARGPCGLRGRAAWALTGRALIDLLAVLPSFVLLATTYARCRAGGGGGMRWTGTCVVAGDGDGDGGGAEEAGASRLGEATGVSLILKGFRVIQVFKAERYSRHLSILRDGLARSAELLRASIAHVMAQSSFLSTEMCDR